MDTQTKASFPIDPPTRSTLPNQPYALNSDNTKLDLALDAGIQLCSLAEWLRPHLNDSYQDVVVRTMSVVGRTCYAYFMLRFVCFVTSERRDKARRDVERDAFLAGEGVV